MSVLKKQKLLTAAFCFCALLLLCLITVFATASCVSSNELKGNVAAQTRYLLFQVFALPAHDSFAAANFPPTADIATLVKDIVKSIGTAGSVREKLGFCVGVLCLSQSDEEVLKLIRESFQVARENNIAVAFHIDDQMFWDANAELLRDRAANIEWSDWSRTASTGRRLEWGPRPAKIAPSLCLNSPVVQRVVTRRAHLIGSEIKRELAKLEAAGKGELFAGVIAGWETQIGSDFATNKSLGYHALSNLGFDSKTSSVQCDSERSRVVKAFIETWAKALAQAGVPAEKIYGHIAFTSQGLDSGRDTRLSYAQKVCFATPDVVFSNYFQPGFSTYPLDDTLSAVVNVVAKYGGNRGWISAEGTNVVPTGMQGEATMESYLGKMFNHGAMMVNIFSWGIGGQAQKNNLFRRATENAEAITAYRKFLSGGKLQELRASAGQFSAAGLRQKIETINKQLPGWIERTRRPDLAMPLMTRLDAAVKKNSFLEADKVADEVLRLISARSATAR
jgi:hypothetical protein